MQCPVLLNIKNFDQKLHVTENRSCMLHSCDDSPNVENLKQDISEIINKHGFKNEDIVPNK